MRWLGWMLMCSAAAGCAAGRSPTTLPQRADWATAGGQTSTRPANSLLTLDQILPQPTLTRPTTIPSGPAPVDALVIYARARTAHLRGDRSGEITLLQQALEKDPYSFQLNYELGSAYLYSGGSGVDSAIRQFEKAAEISPDDLDVRLQLGRQFVQKGKADEAIYQLRLALQTPDYQDEPEEAALVNLFLARALQQKGYDRAALDQYEQLLRKMDGRLNVRGYIELYYVVLHPEMVYIPAGELNEKLGRYDDAIKVYELAAERDPANFGYRAHIVRTLLMAKRYDNAKALAAQLVSDQRASTEALALLKETYRATGDEGRVVDELRQILKRRPGDRSITFALAEVLASAGRAEEAEKLLVSALRESKWDLSIVDRLFEFYHSRDRVDAATRLAIEALSHRPDALDDIDELWAKLMRGSGKDRLRLKALEQLQVEKSAVAAKLFWRSQLASSLGRRMQARQLLEEAVATEPPFAPAYRQLVETYLYRTDWPEDQHSAAAAKVVERARKHGMAALADELNGLVFFSQKKYSEASAAFQAAMDHSSKSARLSYMRTMTLMRDKQAEGAEAALWKIVTDWPSYDEAYEAMFQLYESRRDFRQIDRLMRAWLVAAPSSAAARRHEAEILIAQRRLDDADVVLSELFREQSDDIKTIDLLRQLYVAMSKDAQFLKKMEQERAKHPDNRVLVARLAQLFHNRKQPADALRVLDAMRQAVADDADQLYLLADVYQQIDQKQAAEQVLLQALKLDPQNAAANNYLGYMWADDGKNLKEAEAMIRQAVSAEPDNVAFLDSLGWVLYKLGRYQEAEQHLAAALKAMEEPDPVMLDHLGDVRYRLSHKDEAAKTWQQAMERAADSISDRDEITKLRAQLRQKMEQYKSGRPVDVAPVAQN